MNAILNWWDGVELWLSDLAFVLQVVLVMPVVLLVAYAMTVGFDHLLGIGIQVQRRARDIDRISG